MTHTGVIFVLCIAVVAVLLLIATFFTVMGTRRKTRRHAEAQEAYMAERRETARVEQEAFDRAKQQYYAEAEAKARADK